MLLSHKQVDLESWLPRIVRIMLQKAQYNEAYKELNIIKGYILSRIGLWTIECTDSPGVDIFSICRAL